MRRKDEEEEEDMNKKWKGRMVKNKFKKKKMKTFYGLHPIWEWKEMYHWYLNGLIGQCMDERKVLIIVVVKERESERERERKLYRW